MLIREATPADIPNIVMLAEQAETAAHWSAREYDALFAEGTPKRLALVADPFGGMAIVAFAMVLCATEDWEIENVVVQPEWRRRGIASELLRELLARARQASAAAVLLEVRESNIAAQQLYARLGFSECGRRRGYYSDPVEDALLLRLEIKEV